MNKRMILLLLLVAALTLASCGATPAATVQKPLPEPAALVETVLKSQSFTEEMDTLSEKKVLRALDLTDGSYTALSMSKDVSQTTAETVIVVNATDAAALKDIQAKLEAYRTDTLRSYQDYRPEEAPKLENAKVMTNGLQCVLVVCGDQEKAKNSVNQAWGK